MLPETEYFSDLSYLIITVLRCLIPEWRLHYGAMFMHKFSSQVVFVIGIISQSRRKPLENQAP